MFILLYFIGECHFNFDIKGLYLSYNYLCFQMVGLILRVCLVAHMTLDIDAIVLIFEIHENSKYILPATCLVVTVSSTDFYFFFLLYAISPVTKGTHAKIRFPPLNMYSEPMKVDLLVCLFSCDVLSSMHRIILQVKFSFTT